MAFVAVFVVAAALMPSAYAQSSDAVMDTELRNVSNSIRDIQASLGRINASLTSQERTQIMLDAANKLSGLRARLAAIEGEDVFDLLPAITRFISSVSGVNVPQESVRLKLIEEYDRLKVLASGNILSPGNTGLAVTLLQSTLKQDGSIYPEGLVTGFYGPMTERAVMRFQTQYGLPATGIVDRPTLERLVAIYGKTAAAGEIAGFRTRIGL